LHRLLTVNEADWMQRAAKKLYDDELGQHNSPQIKKTSAQIRHEIEEVLDRQPQRRSRA
jgi:hypothetical protein